MSSTQTAQTTSAPNIYSRITDRIVAALERGVRPWVQPWSSKHTAGPVSRPLRHNGTPYAGINIVALWCTAVERGYVAPIWMTFRQALELDAHVRKGETGTLVVYASSFKVDEGAPDDENTEREVHYLNGYTVFNVEQIDGLPAQYTTQIHTQPNQSARISRVEAFARGSHATVRHGGNRAFYDPQADAIQMPPFDAFRDAERYYATLLHEMTHWSGSRTRLARDLGNRFGTEAYAAEELIAELGAAFLCADLGVTLEPREDHASYIAVWLKVLRDNQRAIFTAASHAQRAAEFLHRLCSPVA
jgi:antirestriction protein ArdC